MVFSLENTWGKKLQWILSAHDCWYLYLDQEGRLCHYFLMGLRLGDLRHGCGHDNSTESLRASSAPTLEHHLPLGPSAERRRCQEWGWVLEEHCCWEDEWVLLKGGEWTSDKGFQGVSEQLWSTGQARASLSIASVSLGRVSVSESESRQEEVPGGSAFRKSHCYFFIFYLLSLPLSSLGSQLRSKIWGTGKVAQQLRVLAALTEDPHGGSQPSIAPVLGDSTPSSGL